MANSVERSRPGLRSQHLTGLRLSAEICFGQLVEGDKIGSPKIKYQPGITPSHFQGDDVNNERSIVADIGTAGSICLLLQTALPCGLYSKTDCLLTLKGGTNATLAPQYDYWERVFLPILHQHFGVPHENIIASVMRRGYFPQGGGEVHVHIKPLKERLKPISFLEPGEVQDLYIQSFHAGKVPKHVAQEMANAARSCLRKQLVNLRGITPRIDVVTEKKYVGSGSGILVLATTTTGCILAGSAVGSPKTPAKKNGDDAALELVSTLNDGGCMDDWLQDQLILFMALAEGTSEILTGSLTLHTQTAIWVAQEMTQAEFQVENLSENTGTVDKKERRVDSDYGQDGRIPGKHIIRCKGIGWRGGLDQT